MTMMEGEEEAGEEEDEDSGQHPDTGTWQVICQMKTESSYDARFRWQTVTNK